MSAPGTYIYCTRFHETKSTLICAIRCPYWHGCKDWGAALAGDLRGPIQLEANEYAARKGITINPEVWDPLQPKKRKRRQPQTGNGDSGIGVRGSALVDAAESRVTTSQSRTPNPAQIVTAPVDARSQAKKIQTPKRSSRLETRTMALEETMTKEPATKTVTPKRRAVKPAGASVKKAKKAGPPNGTVFLILDRSGRYREVKSEEEMKRIAIESAGKGKKGIRFARATVLEVEVTFRPLR
jgi:hypothetical protein